MAATIKRPRQRPGLGQCAKCRSVVPYDRLQFADQRQPKRRVICDNCAAVLDRLGVR